MNSNLHKIVAIHQPNFFPWLGYFDKIIHSDVFIFLDHVQFPKKGGTWSNRVMLMVGGDARWVTAPIVRNYNGVRAIRDMEFQENIQWRDNILKTIINNYSKAPFYKDVINFIKPLVLNKENNLSEYNTSAILTIAQRIGITIDKFCWSSKLSHVGTSNEMLISLTRSMEGDTYMCGGGSNGYQDEEIFRNLEVKLLYQNFIHPVYPQKSVNAFIPGLSIIDAVMNVGWNGVRKILKYEK